MIAAQPGDQLAGRAQRDDLPLVDDRDPVAEPLGLVHVMGREDDVRPPFAQVADHVPELAARLRVEARRRLVEEQELGVADQRRRDGQPLLLAAGKLLDKAFALLSSATRAITSSGLQPVAIEAPEQA